MTYSPIGAKQVSLVGGDEKRVFTVMVSVANDGTLLPFQAIYAGLSAVSRPSKTAAYYGEVGPITGYPRVFRMSDLVGFLPRIF
jgi:hypothetical protein